MATLIKSRGKKLLACDKAEVYFLNAAVPGLETNAHAVIEIGPYIIRVDAKELSSVIGTLEAVQRRIDRQGDR